jgi:hypothetical protein
MPFNIDLTHKNNVTIKLQVVKNIITLYCYGQDIEAAEAVGSKVNELVYDFLDTLSVFKVFIRGQDAPHLKLCHQTEEETDFCHYHYQVGHETVKPDCFEKFIVGIFKAQSKYNPTYYFFDSQAELIPIISAYEQYFQACHKASLEFDRKKLAPKEIASYANTLGHAFNLRQLFFHSTNSGGAAVIQHSLQVLALNPSSGKIETLVDENGFNPSF